MPAQALLPNAPDVRQLRWNHKAMRRKGKQAALRMQQTKKGPKDTPTISDADQKNFQRLMMKSPSAIVDPYVPVPADEKPSLFSAEGLRLRLRSAGKSLQSTVSVGVIKQKLKVFNSVAFAEEAKEIFLLAADAISKQDRQVLDSLVTPNAVLALKQQHYSRKGWTYEGDVERPRCVFINAFATGGRGNQNYFAQVTVQVHYRYSVSGGPVGEALEYIVVERYIESGPGSSDVWKIAGVIDPKNPPKVPAHMQMPSFAERLGKRLMFWRKNE